MRFYDIRQEDRWREIRIWSKIAFAMATPRKQPSILSNPPEEEFHPRTPLGRRLWEIRKRIVESGEPLLDREDLEREVAERRGEMTGSSR
ncbi:MAG TPA: hypothetical protein VGM86_04600 [Thermoanaerobaculia bacterium]